MASVDTDGDEIGESLAYTEEATNAGAFKLWICLDKRSKKTSKIKLTKLLHEQDKRSAKNYETAAIGKVIED